MMVKNETDPFNEQQPMPDAYELDMLQKSGLLEKGVQSCVLGGWVRAGSECYIREAKIESQNRQLHLIFKACIKFDPVNTVNEWLDRRTEIAEAGISVPQLYYRDRAVILEEFIPWTYRDAWQRGDAMSRSKMEDSFLFAYRTMKGLGFSPNSFHDARSRADDFVIIDFGEDLGPPSDIPPQSPHDDGRNLLYKILK